MSLTKVSFSMIDGECVNVLDFGVDNTGAVDCSAGIIAAVAAATASKRTLVFPAGTYKLNTIAPIEIDLGVMSMVTSGNVVLDFSNSSSTYALWVYSSLSYPVSHYQNTTHTLKGFVCLGGGAGGVKGLLAYHPTFDSNAQFTIDSCAFYNFDVNMFVGANLWRVSFLNCVFMYGHAANIEIGVGTNQGESLNFHHCKIIDGGDFKITGTGNQLQLYSCSVLNTTLLITGSSNVVNFYGGNIENPGSALAYKYIDIQSSGNTNRVSLFGTGITINSTTWTDPLFTIAANNILTFSGVTFPDMGGYTAIADSTGYFQFVSGSGFVNASNCFFWPLGGGMKPIVANAMNGVSNGDFETGDTSGWTVTAYGTGGSTAVASATAKKFGDYGLLATSVVGGGINISQTLDCAPGQLVKTTGFVKVATAALAPVGYFQIIFKDASGATLASFGDEISSTSWTILGAAAQKIAPIGTASVTFNLNVQPGGNVVYFDNASINVV